ncbi:anti-sigma factor family protein [Mucilaginibacter gilvus]|uniref:Zf-HC2 domain-containing protein n=1 Tax=Mucilaginibacter gilvus TaxID=2305909 RepID=A0A444MP58_9SPHI|nr:hypothetical protein [Mucilaginibacter gilvus]RWY52423.1 hypothetical protein EPL05_10980 [Mucilaginibacter gilvus]
MNSIEEQLWNYIDGSCTPAEQQAITALIAQDEAYRIKYNELLKLNQEFSTMEMDEPSMAFTYNVMETIRTANALKPLKAAINKRIIWGIAAFFIITIAILVIFALSTLNWSMPSGNGRFDVNIKMPEQLDSNHVKSFFSGGVLKGFLFFDLVMGLFLLDAYLRRKQNAKQH